MKKPDKKYASFKLRFLASFIDTIIASLVLEPVVDYFLGTASAAPQLPLDQLAAMPIDPVQINVILIKYIENMALQTVVLLVVFAVCWRIWSSTPGKMLCRIKVVDANTEQHISNKQAFLRSFGYIVSSIPLCFGFLWIGLDKRKQGWHDKMANTVVISTKGE